MNVHESPADRGDEKQPQALSAERPAYREQLSAMIVEVQSNREVLDCITRESRMFRFTGGSIPKEHWANRDMASYLTRPCVAKCIATADVEHYLASTETLSQLLLDAEKAALPRTLRKRHALTDSVRQALSEVVLVGTRLESAMKSALEGPALVPSSS